MSACNAERERCAKIIAEEFKGVEALQPSFTLADAKRFIKQLTSTLKDLVKSEVARTLKSEVAKALEARETSDKKRQSDERPLTTMGIAFVEDK